MIYLVGVPTLAALGVLQATVFAQVRVLDGAPDLVLLAVVGWGITGHPRQAMSLGLIGGLILDLLSGLPLGVSSLPLILSAYIVSIGEGRFWEVHFLMPLGAVLAASIVYHGAGLGVLFILGRSPDLTFALSRVVLPSVVLNILLALPMAQMAQGLEARLYPPEVGI